jgi:hypothetical protein
MFNDADEMLLLRVDSGIAETQLNNILIPFSSTPRRTRVKTLHMVRTVPNN